MSNGDSGAEFVEEPIDWQALIANAPTVEFGTNFTVNLREIELTAEQLAAIESEIAQLMIRKLRELPNPIPNPGEHLDFLDGLFAKYGRFRSSYAPDISTS